MFYILIKILQGHYQTNPAGYWDSVLIHWLRVMLSTMSQQRENECNLIQ